MKRLLLCPALLALSLTSGTRGSALPGAETTPDLKALMREVCQSEIQILQRQDSRLRYNIQRADHKGTTLRDQIESRDGGVARLLQHNGRTLTVDENDGDRKRLGALLGSNKLRDRERDEAKNRANGVELLRLMPEAMQFAVAAQQTRVPDVADRQIVIDFQPDPQFHPKTLVQQILPALQGRVWIDMEDHQLLRMELHNTSDVNLAWGLIAKVYSGGSVLYDQRRFQDLYAFTHIVLHLRIRELMVKTVSLDTDTSASNFRRLPVSLSGDDAIRILLAEPVPTQ